MVLTECVASETVTVRGEDNVLRVLENKKPRRIFGPSGEKVKGGWKNHTLCNFLIYAVMKFCYDDEGRGIWKDMHYARAKLENLKEGDRTGGK